MDLCLFSVALFLNFGEAIIQNLNYMSIDKEGISVLFSTWHVTSAQTDQAVKFLRQSILMGNQAAMFVFQKKWRCIHLGPLLLTWFNFNPSMDK